MKIASLQYAYDFPKNFDAYQQKISRIIKDLASRKVDLVVFPEYAGLEMLSFTTMENLQEYLPQYLHLFQELSHQYKIYICSGSQVAQDSEGTFNRSYFFSPSKKVSYQDKCLLIPEEVKEGIVMPGKKMQLFETKFGKIGICICYDAEFPPFVKKLVDAGARLILVPSYTSTVHGYTRVFVSSRARALENQCYVVQSPLVGLTDVELAYGAAAICSPVDEGFPEDGLLAIGTRDQPEAVICEIDFEKMEKVRKEGKTLHFADGKKLESCFLPLESFDLR